MAYFRCHQTSVHRTFVIDLFSKQRVKEARNIVEGVETRKIHVMGTLIKEPRPYNWPWSWHLDPSTIEFFENATEVCDASVVDVEKRLAEIGGDFLPRNVWCPWSSRVIEEIDTSATEFTDRSL